MPPARHTGVVKSYSIITLGLLCAAFGWGVFLIPAQIIGGGASGIAALAYLATGIPAGITYFTLNVVLLLLAIKAIGRNFAIKTVFGIVVYSIFLSIAQLVVKEPIVTDDFMAAVIGAIGVGVGIGLAFSQGGSTGGTDIVVAMINKNHNITPGRLFVILDLVIISLSYLIVHSVEKLIFGYCVMVISSYVLDLVLNGAMQSHQIMIFSRNYESIAQRLATEGSRGVTLLEGEGWYSKQKIKVILILVRKNESMNILRIAREEDPNAFISMGQVTGVYGEGFDKIKGQK